MSKDEKTFPTWGYHETEPARIFLLKDGEDLPAGWEDTPAAFEKDEDGKPKRPRGRPAKPKPDEF